MRATVGIAAEQTVVRGVMLSSLPRTGPRPPMLCAVERPVEESTAASVAATLEALAADAEPNTPIDEVGIAYHTVAERHAIVSGLSSESWCTSSLVSARTALLALLDEMLPELAHIGTLLALEVVGYHTSYLVVGPRRGEILASDSWSSGVVDADTAGPVIGRIWATLDAIGVRPDAIVLCGSSAGKPEVVSALQLGLAAPVIQVPDFATAAARGAALVAASPFRSRSVHAPPSRRHAGRVIVIGAAIAALLGGTGVAVMQLRDERPANAAEVGKTVTNPIPAQVSETPAAVSGSTPAPAVPSPVAEPSMLPVESAPGPPSVPPGAAPEIPLVAPPAAPPPVAPVPEDHVAPIAPVVPPDAQQPAAPIEPAAPPEAPPPETPPAETPPAEAPPPAPVTPPDGTLLFPGEPPPPALDAGPAAVQAWWDNHWKLTEQWFGGR
ncbi:hypothetical protein AB0C34_15460 [Nocardia sp. NPDC049220]|uniref:hypothetical protein n=1 Tax=Nocardia sp. NPDC049220 TaxID=3155273 RepID=UPI0033E9BCBB